MSSASDTYLRCTVCGRESTTGTPDPEDTDADA